MISPVVNVYNDIWGNQMMIRVSVKSAEVRNYSGNTKVGGKPFSLDFQTVYVHTSDRRGNPNPYPEKVEIILERAVDGAAKFYPVGEYVLAPSSIYVGRTGDLSISPRLVPFKPEPKPAV